MFSTETQQVRPVIIALPNIVVPNPTTPEVLVFPHSEDKVSQHHKLIAGLHTDYLLLKLMEEGVICILLFA